MKILWVGHNLAYPPKGGALQRNYNLLRQAASKTEVHFLAFDQPRTRPPDVQPGDCIKALLDFCASADWVPLPQRQGAFRRHLTALQGLVSTSPYEVHWLWSRLLQEKVSRLLDKHRFDVVHLDTLGLAQYISLVNNCGTVLNHHDVQSALMARRMERETNLLLRQYWKMETEKLRRAELRWGEAVAVNLVCSNDEATLLLGTDSRMRTTVVANGVDTRYFSPRRDPGGHTLVFCGSLDMYPNQEAMKYFFDAIWPPLRSRNRSVEIYVVGRQPPDWLKNQAALDDQVHVTGFVDDVRPYFEKATICVCPIREGGGTRLKILDSLAMGVPVIGTSFSCSGLNLQHDRDLVMADSAEEFVRQIERLLKSAEARARIASAGRERVDGEYSWDVVGRHLMEAYEKAFALRHQSALK
jgi:glycosyltransferase involved in cell wall biosynthesis